jgi:DNA replication and repair protein RecF
LRLKSIKCENFRNHSLSLFEPKEGINLIHGRNGSGKTSILDAIHYCALTKGFVGALDGECLRFSADYFLLDSMFHSEADYAVSVTVTYKKENEKKIIINNSEIKPFSSHIGTIPCITFSPPQLVIVNGSPAERRRFIDSAISQTDRRYLDDLLSYRRVLQQRNALLSQMKERHISNDPMLPLWTENLSKFAASIVYARVRFIADYQNHFREIYQKVSDQEEGSMLYQSTIGKHIEQLTIDDLHDLFVKKFKEDEKTEIMRAQTISGPHRDDLSFMINGKEVKKYGSQGQLRTFLIALKLSLHRYIKEATSEKPICLLDDIFGEIDEKRTLAILDILENCGQVIITSTEQKKREHITSYSVESIKHFTEK